MVVDPPGNIFPYLALSAGFAPEAARALARRTCFYSFVILALVVFRGRLVLHFLGITLAALTFTMLITYLMFRFAEPLSRHLKESGIRLMTRLMGLILVALAAQFVLDGLRAAGLLLVQ